MAPAHPGFFICEAYNKFGDAEAKCRVSVREPVVVSHPPDSDVILIPSPMKNEPALLLLSSPEQVSSSCPAPSLIQNEVSKSCSLFFPSSSPSSSPPHFPASPTSPETDTFVEATVAMETPASQVVAASRPPLEEAPLLHVSCADVEAAENCECGVVLTVNVSGSPAPYVSWWFLEKELLHGEKYKITSEGDQHICQICDVQMPDAGEYTVMALNPAGKALATLVLRVKPGSGKKGGLDNKRASRIPTKAKTHKVPHKRIATAAEVQTPLVVHESSSSQPADELGKPVVPSVEVEQTTPENQFRLNASQDSVALEEEGERIRPNDNIRNARRPSNLEESLLAPSPGSSSLSRRPSLKESPAHIIKGPDNLTILQGGKVILRTHYIGNPAPTVRWSKGGRPVEPNCRIKMETQEGTSTVTISDLECDDSGKYVVVVENPHGSDCHFSSVSVEGPPEPPADCPNVADIQSTSVTLSWYGSMYDGGSIITGYIVEMKRPDENTWQTVTSNCHSTSFKVRHLVPGNEFMFRIRAQNVHGVSAPSKESEPVYTPLENEYNDGLVNVPVEHHEVAVDKINRFKDLYSLEEEVGKGRFGTVHRVLEQSTKREFAAKIVKCIKALDKEKVRKEIEIMNLLDHPKLLQLVAAFESAREVVMVLEFIRGGELFERVVAEDFVLTEKDCILFMRQICEGVRYLHEKAVIHLDLKPENILCLSRQTHRIKLIDFGLARRYNPKVPLKVMFGTPEFVAPEIISYEVITPMTDMWAVGVICYVLLSGLSPFMGNNDAETFINITRSEFDFDDEAFDTISKEAKHFITALLVKKHEKRMTAEICLRHHWLAQHERTMSTLQLCTDKLKKFIIRRKWQGLQGSIYYRKRGGSLHARRGDVQAWIKYQRCAVSVYGIGSWWRPATVQAC